VVAARCEDGAVGVMVALSRVPLVEGAFRPALRAGLAVDRRAVVEALRQALEKVFDKNRDVTLVVPDASVRVLLLDFDALPGKPAEALPVVRFRLKKLLPFDADDAAVTYQVMSTTRSLVRVLAVAMPREVLAEYEAMVREAGFEPGAMLPSTVAALAGLEETDAPALLVNAGPESVTTAIVRGGVLLLHRSVDMRPDLQIEARLEPQTVLPPTIPAELLANPNLHSLPLVDREATEQEWAMQEAMPEYPVQAVPVELSAMGTAVMERQVTIRTTALAETEALPPGEVVQAVSVAAAYFEDTLGVPPDALLTAGVTSAGDLARLLERTSLAGLKLREMVDAAMIPAGQGPSTMPGAIARGWLAGVRGALRS
jgi:type IV pilus assembly protein PilM